MKATLPIRNIHRVVGTITGAELTRRHGAGGLDPDSIQLHFTGSAGQSFGAFVPRGMTLSLEGDANDYVGKGLSGGKIIVYPPKSAGFIAEENVIIGNVAFYGATSGGIHPQHRRRAILRALRRSYGREGVGDRAAVHDGRPCDRAGLEGKNCRRHIGQHRVCHERRFERRCNLRW